METIFINTENTKATEPHNFVLKLSLRLDRRSLNKHVPFQNLYIDDILKNIRQHYKNNKLKIIAATWNDEFGLSDVSCSVSDIQVYNDYIIKKHEILPTNPPIHIYINRINNRRMFKIKDGQKLELKTPETMKLLEAQTN